MNRPDPLEDRILNRTPDPIFAHYRNEHGHLCIDVPGVDGAGLQRFSAPTLEALVSKLAASIWHGTKLIRQWNEYAKSGVDNEAEAQFYAHPDRQYDEL